MHRGQEWRGSQNTMLWAHKLTPWLLWGGLPALVTWHLGFNDHVRMRDKALEPLLVGSWKRRWTCISYDVWLEFILSSWSRTLQPDKLTLKLLPGWWDLGCLPGRSKHSISLEGHAAQDSHKAMPNRNSNSKITKHRKKQSPMSKSQQKQQTA